MVTAAQAALNGEPDAGKPYAGKVQLRERREADEAELCCAATMP
jgi:hypothetical protein